MIQPPGRRGSLKWIQRAVNERWATLEGPILGATKASALSWVSPLAEDSFAEYRDEAFLERLSVERLAAQLEGFWPGRGPQWDALARLDGGGVVLVEAKAHVAEMCSPGSAAGPASLARIEAALAEVADRLGARADRAPWSVHFYQLANRLAHLDFLRRNGVQAWLALVNFTGDVEMNGPASGEAWEAAYEVAFHVMGLPRRHALSPYLIHLAVPVEAAAPRGVAEG